MGHAPGQPARVRQARRALRDPLRVQRTRRWHVRGRGRPAPDGTRDRRRHRRRTRRALARRRGTSSERRPPGPPTRTRSKTTDRVVRGRASGWSPSARSAIRKPAGEPLTAGGGEAPAATSRPRRASSSATSASRASCRSGSIELSAQAEELRASRVRIVAAHDAERRRLERNIHDGAQQHLVALAVKLRLAKALAATGPGRRRSAGCSLELRDQTELARGDPARPRERDLPGHPRGARDRGGARGAGARGRHAGRGRAAGVERLSIETEAAVYFVCLEAIQNATEVRPGVTRSRSTRPAGTDISRSRSPTTGWGSTRAGTRPGPACGTCSDRLGCLRQGRSSSNRAPGSGTRVRGSIPVREEVTA